MKRASTTYGLKLCLYISKDKVMLSFVKQVIKD